MPITMFYILSFLYVLMFVIGTLSTLSDQTYDYKTALPFNILFFIIVPWYICYIAHDPTYEVEERVIEKIQCISTSDNKQYQFYFNKFEDNDNPKIVRISGHYQNPEDYVVVLTAKIRNTKYLVANYDPYVSVEIMLKSEYEKEKDAE